MISQWSQKKGYCSLKEIEQTIGGALEISGGTLIHYGMLSMGK